MLYDGGFIKKDRLNELKNLNFAFLLDTFKEEREKGMTIDVTYAKFKSKKYPSI